MKIQFHNLIKGLTDKKMNEYKLYFVIGTNECEYCIAQNEEEVRNTSQIYKYYIGRQRDVWIKEITDLAKQLKIHNIDKDEFKINFNITKTK